MIKPNKKRLIITIDEHLYNWLERDAKKLKLTKSQIAQSALLRELERIRTWRD